MLPKMEGQSHGEQTDTASDGADPLVDLSSLTKIHLNVYVFF